VFSGRGLCDGLITRPEESYRLWSVSECDREASTMRRPWPTGGLLCHGMKSNTLYKPERKASFFESNRTESLWSPYIQALPHLLLNIE
jgi:hypothetical protein